MRLPASVQEVRVAVPKAARPLTQVVSSTKLNAGSIALVAVRALPPNSGKCAQIRSDLGPRPPA